MNKKMPIGRHQQTLKKVYIPIHELINCGFPKITENLVIERLEKAGCSLRVLDPEHGYVFYCKQIPKDIPTVGVHFKRLDD